MEAKTGSRSPLAWIWTRNIIKLLWTTRSADHLPGHAAPGCVHQLQRGRVLATLEYGLTNRLAGVNGNNVTNTMALSVDGMTLYFGTAGSGVFRRSTLVMNYTYLPIVFRKP